MDPVFILSSPRSFTSVVAGMVGMHPELYAVPELHILEKDKLHELISFFMTERQEKKLHGLRRITSELLLGEQTLEGVHMADRWLERRMWMSTRDLYQQLIDMTGGLGFVDKSPSYSLSPETLERLNQSFPASKFIHLVRHPIGQGLSMAKLLPGVLTSRSRLAEIRSKYREKLTSVPHLARDLMWIREVNTEEGPQKEIEIDFQYLWLRMQRRIMTFLEQVEADRKMTLRGEDFLKYPTETMVRISGFLNISWNASYEQEILHPERSPYACIGPQGAQFGNDVNYLINPTYKKREFTIPSFSERIIPWRTDEKEFEANVIELATELGYD